MRSSKKDIMEKLAKHKRYCKNCGHSQIVINVDKTICTWCGHYIFRDDKAEFEYKLKQKIK